MIIYSILNTVTNKRYIGRTKHRQHRWSRHRSELKHNHHTNEHLQRAWKRYGAAVFRFEILETCTSEEQMWEREQWWIIHYQSHVPEKGYNLDLGGKGPNLGSAALAKISAAHKGRHHTPEHCRHISEALKGRIISSESRRKTGETLRRRYAEGSLVAVVPPPKPGCLHPMWGKHHTLEARAKISAAQAGKSYEERMGAETAARVIATRRERNKGAANPFYKIFDIEYVKKEIDKGVRVDIIATNLNLSSPTIQKRFRETYGLTIDQYKRKELAYQFVDVSIVKFKLDAGIELRAIAVELGVTYTTLSKKFKETYGIAPQQYKGLVKRRRRNSDSGNIKI